MKQTMFFIPKTADKRYNIAKFTPEVFVVDRWISIEAMDTMISLGALTLTEILLNEFGEDGFQEAYDAVDAVCPEAFWVTR